MGTLTKFLFGKRSKRRTKITGYMQQETNNVAPRERGGAMQDQIRKPGIALRDPHHVQERIARHIYSYISVRPKGLKLYVFHGKAVPFQSRTRFRRSPEFLLLQLLGGDCESHYLLRQIRRPTLPSIHVGFKRRTYQQVIFWSRWTRIVRSLYIIIAAWNRFV